MERAQILLENIDKVIDFIRTAEKLEAELFLVDKNVYMNARSLLGILSMDLDKPLTLEISGKEKDREQAIREFAEYLVQ